MDGKSGKYPRPRPVPALPEFDLYPGKWVAVLDRKVVAAADTPRELLPKVEALGLAGKAIFRYVPPDDDVVVIGVG